jgi:hypothetical protein
MSDLSTYRAYQVTGQRQFELVDRELVTTGITRCDLYRTVCDPRAQRDRVNSRIPFSRLQGGRGGFTAISISTYVPRLAL